MTLEVIGAGFGRTGTASLREALEHLGFVKCHHMFSLREQRGLVRAWHDVALRNARNWDEIFQGFRATVDWPSTAYYKELMEYYPDAKVILTVRDPDSWYSSTSETIYALYASIPGWLKRLPPVATGFAMIRTTIWQGQLHGRFEDPEAARKIFLKHMEDVKANVPSHRLLVYHVQEGWGPLCEFLSVPEPKNKPFPHVNERAEMKRALVVLRLLGKLPHVILAVGLLWLGISFLF